MSVIKYLGKDNENLQAMLEIYEDELKLAATRLALKGITLAQANKEHVGWLVHYDEKRAELKVLMKHFQTQRDRVRGRLLKVYTEKPSIALSERAKEKYIDNDDEFLDANDRVLSVEEVYEKYTAVVDAFKSRGFALRNLVELHVHQLADTPI
jgi:hypothetical protein